MLLHGLPLYHIDRTVEETGDKFGDGSHILYVNGECTDDTALGRLMHDFRCVKPDEMHYPVLREKTRYFKEDEKGAVQMSKVMDEIRAQGYAEGLMDAREEMMQAKEEAAKYQAKVAESEAKVAESEAKVAESEAKVAQSEAREARTKADAEKLTIKQVLRMLRDGLAVDKIAEYTELPLNEVKDLAALAGY